MDYDADRRFGRNGKAISEQSEESLLRRRQNERQQHSRHNRSLGGHRHSGLLQGPEDHQALSKRNTGPDRERWGAKERNRRAETALQFYGNAELLTWRPAKYASVPTPIHNAIAPSVSPILRSLTISVGCCARFT